MKLIPLLQDAVIDHTQILLLLALAELIVKLLQQRQVRVDLDQQLALNVAVGQYIRQHTCGDDGLPHKGGKGEDYLSRSTNSYGRGGYNGGGDRLTTSLYGIEAYVLAGGGATDIRIGGTSLADRKMVAAGAGGDAYIYDESKDIFYSVDGATGTQGVSSNTIYVDETYGIEVVFKRHDILEQVGIA